jgi:enoyl-CoA hydratase/carnithine racemase
MREQYAYYDLDIVGKIAVLRFRPEPLGKPSQRDVEESTDLLQDIAAAPDVNVAVFIGTADRFGPAPRAPRPPGPGGPEGIGKYNSARALVHALVAMDKPIVTALTGDVQPPLGMSLALFSDIAVAERHITFRETHTALGVPASSSAFAWPRLVGLLAAKRYVLTAEPLPADEAGRIGLVTEVVDDGGAECRAMEFAATLASLRPEAVRHTKRALNEIFSSRMIAYDIAQAEARLVGPPAE